MSVWAHFDDFCWLCSTQSSCCNCSPWSNHTLQNSFSLNFDGHEKSADFDVDELACLTTDANHFLEVASYKPEDMSTQISRRWSYQSYAASTPKNNDWYGDEKRAASPGTALPPDSSSPDCGFGMVSPSPFSTGPALPLTDQVDVIVDQLWPCGQALDGGQWHVKAPIYNDHTGHTGSNASFLPTSTGTHHSLTPLSISKFREHHISSNNGMGTPSQDQHHPSDTSDRNLPIVTSSPKERSCTTGKPQAVAPNAVDICAVATRPVIERTTSGTKSNAANRHIALGCPDPPRKRALRSALTMLDLAAISAQLGAVLPHGSTDDRSRSDATVAVPMIPAQAKPCSRLKRRLSSSADGPPSESKRAKLDRKMSVLSHVDPNVESKYQATEPASIRRARSLRSEASILSAQELTDSTFNPSPLKFASEPVADEDCPPTIPSTPLPDSAAYARSKANPLVRTIAIYRRRSLSIPPIPPVPIIAPPADIDTTTVVKSAEDRAIDRIQALLLRERAERERDGLSVYDDKRSERSLKVTPMADPGFPRRDTASTSDSNDIRGQWEEELSPSKIEALEHHVPIETIEVLPVPHRFVNREAWISSFGIPEHLREKITKWILEMLPKEPVPEEKAKDGRPLGTDLYEQLTNSPQTRFHAAQLFHRYLFHSDKAQLWKEAYEGERLEKVHFESEEKSGLDCDIWDIAVACMALSVKLHRDCLPPLGPMFAAEFLAMSPRVTMTQPQLEVAQRDIFSSMQFMLGSCTPQDVLDELWNALPTLRRATSSMQDGWAVVQRATWDKLFATLLEPDMLQFPVTLLTAAALVEGLGFSLVDHYRTEAEANACKCHASVPQILVSDRTPDDFELWQVHHFEAGQLVDDVILDVRDVLQVSAMELDECRVWLGCIGH